MRTLDPTWRRLSGRSVTTGRSASTVTPAAAWLSADGAEVAAYAVQRAHVTRTGASATSACEGHPG